MIRQVGIMKAKLNAMQESLDVLMESRNGEMSKRARLEPESEVAIDGLLPIKSVEELENKYNHIADDNIKKALVIKK